METLHRNYGNISGSMGFTYKLLPDLLLRGNMASAYRTPNIAELTQDGMHGARYELGDRNLKSQRNYEADLSLHFHSKLVMTELALFYNHINDYIFLSPTSDTTDEGQQVFRYMQNNAVLHGAEFSVEVLPLDWLKLRGSYAHLRGKQENGSNLPLIPQDKIMASATFTLNGEGWYKKAWFNAGCEFAFKQGKPSPFETPTNSYLLLNLGMGASLQAWKQPVDLTLTLNNIFDKTYIDHLSTLKDLGYYNIGRNLTFSIKIPLD